MKFKVPGKSLNVSIGDGKTYKVENGVVDISGNKMKYATGRHLLTLGWSPLDGPAEDFIKDAVEAKEER